MERGRGHGHLEAATNRPSQITGSLTAVQVCNIEQTPQARSFYPLFPMTHRFNTISTISKSITTIVVLPGVKEERFEQFMREDVFPAVNLATRLFETREHVLLRSDQKVEGRSQYLWTVFATTTDDTQGDNHLVDLLTESDTRAALTAKLKPYGTLLGFTDSALASSRHELDSENAMKGVNSNV